MLPETKKNLVLVMTSGLLALAMGAAWFEWRESLRYEAWKQGFEDDREWYGGITVASPNEKLMWEYLPNAATSPGFAKKQRFSVETNNHGFRDEDFNPARSPGTFRTAFVGDSVTLGLRVSHDRSFAHMVEELAARDGSAVALEAMNFGVDGYNTLQIGALLESRVVRFDPDLVVYALCLNDFDLDDASGNKIRYFRKPRSFLAEKLQRAAGNVLNFFQKKEYHAAHFAKNRDTIFREISRMKERLDQAGIGFAVVLVPVFFHEAPDFHDYALLGLHGQVRAFLESIGVTAVDVLDGARSSGLSPRALSFDIWHPNESGHEFIARVIYEELLAAQLSGSKEGQLAGTTRTPPGRQRGPGQP